MSHTRLIWLLTLLLLAGSVLGVAWLSGAPFAPAGTPPSTLPPPPAARPAPLRVAHRAPRSHVPRMAPAPAASVVEAPAVATMSAPRYPIAALRGRHEGIAVVHVEVAAAGRATAATLVQSSGWPELDRAALEAVRQWHFRAARRDGRAVDGALDVPVRFRIDADGG